jgi:carbohydrate-selective porin OprB
MKFALALVAGAALFAMSPDAFAQGKGCGARPDKPSIPNGKSASVDDMKTANGKLATYVKAVNDYRQCLGKEIDGATAEAKKASDDYAEQVKQFNATPAKQ